VKITALKVNTARAERGDWVPDIPNMGDVKLKVRGFSNTDFTAFMAKQVAAVGRDKRVGNRAGAALLPGVIDEIMARGMVEAILVDWKGLTDENDKPLPYSKEMATKFITDPDYRPFRDAVSYAAGVVEEFEADKVEGVVGNSASASAGTSLGRRKRST
jgi:hypothetical protein